MNYVYLGIIYKNNCFSDIKVLINSIKSLIPFLFLSKSSGDVLFIASQFAYTKTICNTEYTMFVKKLICRRPGVFSNFGITSSRIFTKLDFVRLPSAVVLFNSTQHDYLLEETRLKNIPTIGLVLSSFNTSLVDYPIFVNSTYFHTVYFFTKIFTRFLILEK